ncbi:MAG: DUF58 domain-containing protein [Thermoanaerobaculia bacterium]
MESVKEILKNLKKIEIYTNRLVEQEMGGVYRSVFKGKGIEFFEVREFQEGDDIRSIDWNVTARMGQPYVKTYLEERELTVYILVDLSSSEDFGSMERSKRNLSGLISALISFSAIKNNDRVGLILFTDKVEKHLPPKKGKDHIMHLLREILFFEPEGKGTDIKNALNFFGRICPKRAILFLISDFFDSNFEREARILARKHDFIAIQTLDEREENFDLKGLLKAEDIEEGREFLIDFSSEKVREYYKNKMKEFQENLEKFFKTSNIDYLKIMTSEDPFKPLEEFFKERKKRKRGAL